MRALLGALLIASAACAQAPDRSPAVGDKAPDFTLEILDGKGKKVKLSSFKGKKPVLLIFGSYT